MNDKTTFKPVERTSTPEPSVNDDGKAIARFGINTEPDYCWEQLFKQTEFETYVWINKRDRSRHPGLRSIGPDISFSIPSADRLPDLVAALDAAIEAANQGYVEKVIPADEAKAEKEAR